MIPDNVKIIVADTETTSADPDRGVCEVGWAEIDRDFKVLDERQSLIDPEKKIASAASGIHGLTNDDVANSPTLAEYFSEDDPTCYGRKIQGPAIVVGHRISFDTHTMAPHIDGEIFEVCTLRWARRLYPHAGDHKLSTLMFELGLPRPQGAHRVMSDVYSAMYLVQHICERVGVDIVELARMSQQPFLVEVMPFGKNKGAAFKDVPRSYLAWMKREMKDLDIDIKHTLDHYLNK